MKLAKKKRGSGPVSSSMVPKSKKRIGEQSRIFFHPPYCHSFLLRMKVIINSIVIPINPKYLRKELRNIARYKSMADFKNVLPW